ncbi:MAG: class B sortase [Oscillospiraceae bacterium]|nr:class B sortase [Oscillospiraceae bacterium]
MNHKIAQSLQKIQPTPETEERIFREVVNRAAGSENQRKGNVMQKNIIWLSGAVAACVVIATSVIMLPNMLEKKPISIIVPPSAVGTKETIVAILPSPPALDEYKVLKTENPDTVGYIRIGTTKINYPVVQTDNNEFYLDRDFNKNASKGGWIFADYRNKFDDELALSENISDNTILYGHNITTGSFFSALTGYYRDTMNGTLDFYKENPVIEFDTLYEKAEWKVFACTLFNTQEEYGEVINYWDFRDFAEEDEFQDYIKTITDRSVLSTDVDIEYGDKLLTLSTCYWPYTNIDTRLVVFARKVRDGERSEVNVGKAFYNEDFVRFEEEIKRIGPT